VLRLPGQASYAALGRAYGELQYADDTVTLLRQYIDTPCKDYVKGLQSSYTHVIS
jgi:hypothetical protein